MAEYHNPPPTSEQLRAQIGVAVKAGTLIPESVANLERIADEITRFEATLQAASDRGATVINGTLELQ